MMIRVPTSSGPVPARCRPRAGDPEEIRRLVRAHPYFAPLGEAEREVLIKRSRVLRVRRNGVLFAEGEPARSLPLLLFGRVKVVKESSDGREQTLRVVDPGETFSEADVIRGRHGATAVALHSSRVLQMPAGSFRALIRSRGDVAEAVASGFAETVARLADLAADLSLLSVTARVARLLLTREDCLAGAIGGLSQQEMASLAGTARQVVGRILRRMEEQGIIELERGRTRVLDPERLEILARLR